MDFLKYVKGMFSLALFDKKLNKIFIIRDKFGIKPLFYFYDSNYFIFASEIKILLSHKIVKNSLEVDSNEIFKFIGHGQIYGFDKTLLKNIKILEPSQYIEFNLNNKKFQIETYNNEVKNIILNETYDNDFFEKKFNEVVNYHTITEHKKIACLLSGGIDSTLLSVILKAQSDDKEIHTFSSILNEPNEENKNIPKLVKENNFIQHYIYEDSINFFDDHLKTIKDMDLPTTDGGTVLHNVLCREVSKNGFKVLFTGNGGDEHFFGYPLHIYGYLADVLKSKNIREYFSKISNIKKYSNKKELILRSLIELINLNILNSYKRFQLSKRLKHLDFDSNFKEINFYESFSDNIFKNIIINYKKHWCMQYFLDYEDKNSMAYGIESRVPYLDYDLANLSFKTSVDKHFEIGTKSLLRFHKQMPNYVKTAREKFGFAAHLEGYVDKSLNKMKEKIFYDFKDLPLININ